MSKFVKELQLNIKHVKIKQMYVMYVNVCI